MSELMTDAAADRATLARIEQALRMVTVPLPHLSGLAAVVRVNLDWRVPTMGIFASGRLVANPGFVARLKDNELVFVLAHELLHLALRTHDRARGSGRLEFNYAHDYIINDILRTELGFSTIPAGGLDMPGARERSAEEIVIEMRRNADCMPSRTRVFEGQKASIRQVLDNNAANRGEQDAGDVLADQQERDMYPADTDDQDQQKELVTEVAMRGQDLAAAMRAMRARGTAGGATSRTILAQRGQFRPAWQIALQKWIESSAPGERTFTRSSRRGLMRDDMVLPGRKRQSWMLNIILDTSGSMTQAIPAVLGTIADFCDAAGVDQVRIIQCDTEVTADDTVAPQDLASYPVAGFDGSDLTPAMLAIADDPLVTAAVIITDGDITYPLEPMPYSVVWVLPADSGVAFSPPYGRVLVMEGDRA